jgi:phage gp36-like protein
LLTRIAVQITLYHLFLRRNLTDSRKDEYANCQQMLKDLQTGKLRLECQQPDSLDVNAPGASYTQPVALFAKVPAGFYTGQAYPW